MIEAVYEEALALSSGSDPDFVQLGRCLRKLQDRDPALLRKLTRQTGLGTRKAYYLIEIARRLHGLGLSRARLEKIGWTKVQVIAGHITRENATDLMLAAEANSTRKLQALMRDEHPLPTTHCVLLYFSPAQYRAFEKAARRFGAARSGRGLVEKEAAVIRMVAEAMNRRAR